MTDDNTRQTILTIVQDVAPEVDTASVDTSAHFMEGLGLDSMDYLELVTRVYEKTGVDIPEKDYEQAETIDQLVAYVEAHQ